MREATTVTCSRPNRSHSRKDPPTIQPVRDRHTLRMIRFRTSLIAALLAVAAASSAAIAQTRDSSCGDADRQRYLHERIVHLLAETDSASIAWRRMYEIDASRPEEITVVTEDTLCVRAASAYYRYRLGRQPEGGVVVIRAGDVYVVQGKERMGEWTLLVTYNGRFEELARLAH